MADQDNDLFAIEIDADDYAEAAATDTPAVSRTFQSEYDFQGIKAAYSAKVDGGTSYQDLITAVPALKDRESGVEGIPELQNGHTKVKLSKKDGQLLGYAVGEFYYDKEFGKVVNLCQRVRQTCVVDGKTEEALGRWEKRCKERMR